MLGSRSDKAGQGRAGRRETTKDTSGARECGWWMDGDLVWGWEIGSLETTRWRRDRSVPNVMLRACDWCEGSLGCAALLESALMVTSRQALFSDASLRVLAIVLTAANMRAWPLPSRPFTRVAEQRRGALSRSLHALLRRLGPQANAAPARHLLQPHSRQRDAVAVPQRPARMYVDVPCRAGLAVCAAGFTCRRAARPALARWWCGINCLDVPLSRAARPTTTRETDRVGPPKLCPQSISLRCMIGHRCATVAFVALALARMPLQAHAGPSMSASASSRARSDSALAD